MAETFLYEWTDATSETWFNPENLVDADATSYTHIDVPADTVEDSTSFILTTANDVDATALINIDTTGFEVTYVGVYVTHSSEANESAVWMVPVVNEIEGGHYQFTTKLNRGTSLIDITDERLPRRVWSVEQLQNLQLKFYGGNSHASLSKEIYLHDLMLKVVSGDETSVTPIVPDDSTGVLDTTGWVEFETDYFDSTAINDEWVENYVTDGSSEIYIDSTTSNGYLLLSSGGGEILGKIDTDVNPSGLYQSIAGDFDVICKISGKDGTLDGCGLSFILDNAYNSHMDSYSNTDGSVGSGFYQKTVNGGTVLTTGYSAYSNLWWGTHAVRYFRLQRIGSTIISYNSRDGSIWIPGRQFQFAYSGPGKLWLFANDDSTQYEIAVDYVKNIRPY